MKNIPYPCRAMGIQILKLLTTYTFLSYLHLPQLCQCTTNGCVKDYGKPNIKDKVIDCFDTRAYEPDSSELCKAGLVKEVKVSFRFIPRTNKYQALVEWKPTLFGLENLWGYEVYYVPRKQGHIQLDQCKQILDKRTNITLNNFLPETEYHFTVLSLPRHKFDISEGTSITERTEDLCTALRKDNVSLALKCMSPKLRQNGYNCASGTIDLTFGGVPHTLFKEYLIEWKMTKDKNWLSKNLTKSLSRYRLLGLNPEEEYLVKIMAWKGFGEISQDSNIIKFSCLVPPRNVTIFSDCKRQNAKVLWEKPHHFGFDSYMVEWKKSIQQKWEQVEVDKQQTEHEIKDLDLDTEYDIRVRAQRGYQMSNGSHEFQYLCRGEKHLKYIIVSIVLSVAFLLAVVLGAIYCRLHHKLWGRRYRQGSLDDPEMVPSPLAGPMVVMFHDPGCKYVRHVACQLANLFRKAEIKALSFTEESNRIHDKSPGWYLNEKLKEVDYVVLLHSKTVESSECSEYDLVQLYKMAVELCTNRNIGPKVISMYFCLRNGLKMFGDYSVSTHQEVPFSLRRGSYRCPKDILELIRRFVSPKDPGTWTIPESLAIDKLLLEKIRRLTATVLLESHADCYREDCYKGVLEYAEVVPRTPSFEDMSSTDSLEELRLCRGMDSGFQDAGSCASHTPSNEESGQTVLISTSASRNSRLEQRTDEQKYIPWIPQNGHLPGNCANSSINSDRTSSSTKSDTYTLASGTKGKKNEPDSPSPLFSFRRLISNASVGTVESEL